MDESNSDEYFWSGTRLMVASIPQVQSQADPPPSVLLQRGNRQLLASIRDEWLTLCAEGPCNDPRLTPDWIEVHLATFEPHARIALVTVRINGQLRGVLPMVEQRFGFGPVALRWFRSASGIHSTQFDLVHGADDEQSVIAAVWDYFQSWKEWDVLHFRSVMNDGGLDQIIGMAARYDHPVGARGAKNVWWVPIDPIGQDPQSFTFGRSRTLRQQVRKESVRLAKLGDVQLRVLSAGTDPATFRDGLEAFYVMEAAGWKGAAGTAIASDPNTLAFYNAIADLGRREEFILLNLLELNGIPIAGSFNVIAGHQLIGMKTAYLEEYSSYSPGHLLTAHVLADCAARGLTALDLGGTPAGDHAYKSAWTSESRPGYTGLIHQTNLRGRMSHLVLFRLLPWVQARSHGCNER
jgi:CelD/BcsL family acetyltransferase involved in cellulose biosynthesis